jgi:hypothetical protein
MRSLTDVCKLAVLKDDKVQLLAELEKLLGQRQSKVLDDVNVCLA